MGQQCHGDLSAQETFATNRCNNDFQLPSIIGCLFRNWLVDSRLFNSQLKRVPGYLQFLRLVSLLIDFRSCFWLGSWPSCRNLIRWSRRLLGLVAASSMPRISPGWGCSWQVHFKALAASPQDHPEVGMVRQKMRSQGPWTAYWVTSTDLLHITAPRTKHCFWNKLQSSQLKAPEGGGWLGWLLGPWGDLQMASFVNSG